MKNKAIQMLVGWVKFFDMHKGFGFVATQEIKTDLYLSERNGPFVVEAGINGPVFTDRLFKCRPDSMEEIMLQVGSVGHSTCVLKWTYQRSWDNAVKEIARRPQYRVIRTNRFKGQMMPASNQFDVPFVGTAEQMQAKCLRDGLVVSTRDQFAPSYKTGPITATHRFEKLIVTGEKQEWVKCEDPRPLPAGFIKIEITDSRPFCKKAATVEQAALAATSTGTTPSITPANPKPAIAMKKFPKKEFSTTLHSLAQLA